MKKVKLDIEFDEAIGLKKTKALTTVEHDEIRAYRQNLYENR